MYNPYWMCMRPLLHNNAVISDAFSRRQRFTHMYTHQTMHNRPYTYILYMCICINVCVCVIALPYTKDFLIWIRAHNIVYIHI